MKTLRTIMIIAVVLTASITAVSAGTPATTFNARLLLHATKPVTDSSNWGLAGWAILPNYAAAPSKTLYVLGPRYNGGAWWVEVMAGAVVKNQKATGLIDIRASYDAQDPIHFWGEVMCFQDWSKFTFAEANYRIGQLGLVGVETENDHCLGRDNLSIGPHLIVPFAGGKFVMQGAYQFHNQGGNQVWFRTVLNF